MSFHYFDHMKKTQRQFFSFSLLITTPANVYFLDFTRQIILKNSFHTQQN